MKFHRTPLIVVLFLLSSLGLSCYSQHAAETAAFIYGDALPDAPDLAPRGPYKVGVRTLQLIHAGQPDIAKAKNGEVPVYDRPLTVEVWYPAVIPSGTPEMTEYEDILGRPNTEGKPLIPFTFPGRALRDAEPDRSGGAYPLIIVSHGYPGSRFLMTYLTENLASKGYVVAAIDHTESTHRDAGPFPSTLYHRPLDILFVLDEMARLSGAGSSSFLSELADADNTALIGYSMGGYGVLNVAGAGYSQQLLSFFSQMTGGSNAIQERTAGAPAMVSAPDKRIKAVVAFAPWGMARGVWDSLGLAGLRVPTFFVAGDQDDISGYEDGIKAIYKGAVNTERYLLTYANARHNVAPNPPPAATLTPGPQQEAFMHYAEPAWSLPRMNNINQHFVTAFLGLKLKGQDHKPYLELPEHANETSWKGFKLRTSVGLSLEYAE
ncbi:MAG TPA: dienelactone hydrolase [Flavilitoribacter sp.]|nr:dienelactone hydrolase [Flavilitoribacter sp.]